MNDVMQRVGVIHLSSGGFTVVDLERLDELNKFKWSLTPSGYVSRSKWSEGRTLNIRLHREVFGVGSGDPEVDHRYGDKLDNRARHLRFATRSQNGGNAKPQTGRSSAYKGVYWEKSHRKWHAMIGVNSKRISLGRFNSEADAANAYNKAALKYFGEFARVNEIP